MDGETADDMAETPENGFDPMGPGVMREETPLRRESSLISRNLVIGQRRTSARLEPEMWSALFDISRREHRGVNDIATLVDQNRPSSCSLTAALRVFIMAYFRSAATEEGHSRAGHGYGRVLYGAPANKPLSGPNKR